MYVRHKYRALITYSYERNQDLLYFGDTYISLHTLVQVYDHSYLGH